MAGADGRAHIGGEVARKEVRDPCAVHTRSGEGVHGEADSCCADASLEADDGVGGSVVEDNSHGEA